MQIILFTLIQLVIGIMLTEMRSGNISEGGTIYAEKKINEDEPVGN